MTVTHVHKDPEALTMTITAELDADVDRAWQLWADPRQLERWWGPPTYPATVVDHELAPGGAVTYFFTGPAGDRSHGWLRIVAVDPPHRLEFTDGFADDRGVPDDAMPVMTIIVTLAPTGGGRTRMVEETHFPSLEAMEQMIAMGMDEGLVAGMGQIDEVLAGEASEPASARDETAEAP
jgi:uncharacterized protein YndB with AHSA1/START domain